MEQVIDLKLFSTAVANDSEEIMRLKRLILFG